jgi:hypothetical protein
VTSLGELKLRIFVEIETVRQQMLENAWRDIEHPLGKMGATKGAYIEAI